MPLNDILNELIIDKDETKTFVPSKTKKVSCNFDDEDDLGIPKIKIFGIGGAGNNIIEYLGKIRN
jgi:cell division GTPase FtsZ